MKENSSKIDEEKQKRKKQNDHDKADKNSR